jgi:hypothetical protein
MIVFRRSVSSTLVDSSSVVEVSGSHCFLDGNDLMRTLDNDLDTVAQLSELISDITDSTDGFELDEIFVAPLLRVSGLGPLFEDVEKGKVITAGLDERFVSLVGMDLFVFGPVKQRAGFLEHRDDGQNLHVS